MLVSDPFNGGLGGQAGAHSLFQRPVPAAIVGEHPVGFQHLERLTGQLALAPVENGVDPGLERDQGLAQADLLDLLVLGQQVFGRDRCLV